MLHPVADCQPLVPVYDSQDSNQDSEAAISFLADLYGNPTTYGYITRQNGGWTTARVRADKGTRTLPDMPGEGGRLYYALPLKPPGVARAYRTGQIIGTRGGTAVRGKTRHFTIDVDRDSRYHPANDLAAWASLVTLFQDRGIEVAVVTSSASGGLHIIAPFSHPRRSITVAKKLSEILQAGGFELGQGHLEAFPNTPRGAEVWMNGCRLPCIEPASYPVDPFSLTPLGWRVALVESMQAAIAVNEWRAILGTTPAPMKPSATPAQPGGPLPGGHGPQVAAVSVGGEGEREKPQHRPKPHPSRAKGFGFNLASRFQWSDQHRSNAVIGAHAAYVVQRLGITDEALAVEKTWERLYSHGYEANASSDEKRDRQHALRWVRAALRARGYNTTTRRGPGDKTINEARSADTRSRLRMALRWLRKCPKRASSGNELWAWVNSYLHGMGLAGLAKRTFLKLRLLWAAMIQRPSPPHRGSPPLLKRGKVETSPMVSGVCPVSAPPDPPDPGCDGPHLWGGATA